MRYDIKDAVDYYISRLSRSIEVKRSKDMRNLDFFPTTSEKIQRRKTMVVPFAYRQ